MKLSDSDNKKRRGRIVSLLVAAAVLLGALAFARGASFFTSRLRAEDVITRARAQSNSDPNELRTYLETAQEVAKALKEKNLFVKRPPRQHPVKQVDGILGNEALIAGKWYKAGAKIGDAKILAVEPTCVRVEWDGKEKVFAPLASASAQRPPSAKPPEKVVPKDEKPKAPAVAAQGEGVQVKVVSAPVEEDPFAWMGVDLPPRARAKIQEMWSKMSDEEKQEAKADWNRMSDGEKQQAIDSIEDQG